MLRGLVQILNTQKIGEGGGLNLLLLHTQPYKLILFPLLTCILNKEGGEEFEVEYLYKPPIRLRKLNIIMIPILFKSKIIQYYLTSNIFPNTCINSILPINSILIISLV